MIAVLAVLAITVLVLIDWSLQLILAWRARRIASRSKSRTAHMQVQEPFDPPIGLFYHKGHSWVFMEPNGRFRIGLDGLVAFVLGRFDNIILPECGQHVQQSDPLVRISSRNRTLILSSPVDGTVVDINSELVPDGLFVSSEPYGAGWICEIIPDSLSLDLKKLMVADQAIEWHIRESTRMSEYFLSKDCGDIGLDATVSRNSSSSGVLNTASDEVWVEFQSEFLNSKQRRRTKS